MLMLTDGLQALAGDRLRSALRRYTRTRPSAILTGAAVTAVVQSSSATTLAVIGFVGAGLLSFRQALGVEVRAFLELLGDGLTPHRSVAPGLEDVSLRVAALRREARGELLSRTADGEIDPAAAENLLEAFRWLDRIAYHFWRTAHHLDVMDHDMPSVEPPAPESRGRRADETHDMS